MTAPVTEHLDQLDNAVADSHKATVVPFVPPRSEHMPGTRMAKTLIIKADGKLAMAVLPANMKVDCQLLQEVMGVEALTVLNDGAFDRLFAQCDAGGMPPLDGNSDIPVYMDTELLNYFWLTFKSSSQPKATKMDTGVFKRLVQPILGEFAAER